MAYLVMLSDWLMSWQAWPPHAYYGQWARCKYWTLAVYFLYKMACFNGVYLKYCEGNSTGILIWYKNNFFFYLYKILRWYDEKLLCCCRVKIFEFTMNKQGVSQCFHPHAWAPSMAGPGWVDKRIIWSPTPSTPTPPMYLTDTWWCHQMGTSAALLALCVGNSPATGEFPSKGQWCRTLIFCLICAWTNVK